MGEQKKRIKDSFNNNNNFNCNRNVDRRNFCFNKYIKG